MATISVRGIREPLTRLLQVRALAQSLPNVRALRTSVQGGSLNLTQAADLFIALDGAKGRLDAMDCGAVKGVLKRELAVAKVQFDVAAGGRPIARYPDPAVSAAHPTTSRPPAADTTAIRPLPKDLRINQALFQGWFDQAEREFSWRPRRIWVLYSWSMEPFRGVRFFDGSATRPACRPEEGLILIEEAPSVRVYDVISLEGRGDRVMAKAWRSAPTPHVSFGQATHRLLSR